MKSAALPPARGASLSMMMIVTYAAAEASRSPGSAVLFAVIVVTAATAQPRDGTTGG